MWLYFLHRITQPIIAFLIDCFLFFYHISSLVWVTFFNLYIMKYEKIPNPVRAITWDGNIKKLESENVKFSSVEDMKKIKNGTLYYSYQERNLYCAKNGVLESVLITDVILEDENMSYDFVDMKSFDNDYVISPEDWKENIILNYNKIVDMKSLLKVALKDEKFKDSKDMVNEALSKTNEYLKIIEKIIIKVSEKKRR